MELNRDVASLILKLIYFLLLLFLIIKRKKLGKAIDVFILVILATFLTELFGLLYRLNFKGSNYFIYNVGITLIVFFLIYLYYFKILENKVLKKIQFGIICIHLIVYLFSIFMVKHFFKTFLLESYMLQIVLLLISISLFFYETFNSEKIFGIKKYYSFWVSVSLLIIYIGILPALIVGTSSNTALNTNIYGIIMFCVNFIGYGLLFFGAFYSSSQIKN